MRYSITAILICIIAIPQAMPLLGFRLIEIQGKSMAPIYEMGDLLLTTKPQGDEPQLGQILVVGNPPDIYTHRVVEVHHNGATVKARLQGDANSVPDPFLIEKQDIYAIPVKHYSNATAIFLKFITSRVGVLLIISAIIALVFIPRNN